MTADNKKTLIDDLKKFGLNPKEWTLKRVGSLRFQIRHKKDANFAFLGQGHFVDSHPQWARLQLISL